MAPAALDVLIEQQGRSRIFPAAMICAAIFNTHNDWTKNPDGWRPQDFMPGAKLRSDEDDMREFVLALERGDDVAPTPEDLEHFKRNLQQQFRIQAPTSNVG